MLKNKIALVTGAAQGIGRAVAMTLAENGAAVVVNDIEGERERALALVKEMSRAGSKAAFIPADVSDYDDVTVMMKEIAESFGTLNVLINNAALLRDRTLNKMTPEEWNRVIHVNLTGVYHVVHLALPLLQDGGRIISISSVASLIGSFAQCNYAASKGGINAFTKSLARELGRRKITVNAVAPGLIKTRMTAPMPPEMLNSALAHTPLGELGTPEDVANAVLFLASENARYITGAVIPVSGGMNL
ncbi:SDR family oxidoreductase [Thermodesulfobacteriota bacterium]